MFAKFSPDASRVAYVKSRAVEDGVLSRAVEDGVLSNDIYVERLDTGAIVRLTTRRIGDDHQRHVRLGLRGGARRPRRVPLEPRRPRHRLLAVRFDRRRHLLADQRHDDAVSRRSRRFRIRRPAPRTPPCASASCPPTAAQTTWMQTPGDPRQNYLARLEWLDPRHGRDPAAEPAAEPERLPARRRHAPAPSTRVFRDESKTWVEVVEEVRWIDDGPARSCGSASATAGSTSIACRARAATARLITSFDADVTDVVGIDEAGGWLYFLASPANATRALPVSIEARRRRHARARDAGRSAGHACATIWRPDGRLAFHT